jgi:hypothetical protein
MKKIRRLFLLLLVLAMPAAAAPELALDATGGVRYGRGTFANFGWSFSTSEDRVVTSLGLWSFTTPGLSDEHQVGIWNSSGVLIVSAVVTDADTAVGSASAAGVWRFHSVAATLLAAGTYTIGAYYPTTSDQFRGSSEQAEVDLILPSWLSYVEGLISNGADGNFFQQPTRSVGDNFNPAFFGPNFLSSDVPEPGTLVLVLLALAAFGLRTRRR